jgi:hypothetical protein
MATLVDGGAPSGASTSDTISGGPDNDVTLPIAQTDVTGLVAALGAKADATATTTALAAKANETELAAYVKTINHASPDGSGDVEVVIPSATGVVPYHNHNHLVEPLGVVKHTASMLAAEFTITQGLNVFIVNANSTFTIEAPQFADSEYSPTSGARTPFGSAGPEWYSTAAGGSQFGAFPFETRHIIDVAVIQDDVGGHSVTFQNLFEGAPVALTTGATYPGPATTTANAVSFWRFTWYGLPLGWVRDLLGDGAAMTIKPLPSSTSTYIRGHYVSTCSAADATAIVTNLKMIPLNARKVLYAAGLYAELAPGNQSPSLICIHSGDLPGSRSQTGSRPLTSFTRLVSPNGSGVGAASWTNNVNPVLHESGHALDFILYRNGVPVSGTTYYRVGDDPRFISLYNTCVPRSWTGRNDYYLVDNAFSAGGIGKNEWMAQMLGCYTYYLYLTNNSLSDATLLETEWSGAAPDDIIATFKTTAASALSAWLS